MRLVAIYIIYTKCDNHSTHPNHHWYGYEGYLTDKGRQSTRPIRHSGGDDTSSRWHGHLHDPWPRSCNHPRWQGTLWLGAEFHSPPLQGKGGRIGKGQLLQSQADRAGHESPGEDCGQPHQIVCVNRRFPVWLRPRQRHNRHNLYCQAAAREVSSCQ